MKDPVESVAWLENRIMDSYRRGRHNKPKWDIEAEKAFKLYAKHLVMTGDRTGNAMEEMASHARSAREAGCEDPLVQYIEMKFGPASENATRDQVISNWIALAERLDKSPHTTSAKLPAQVTAWLVWRDYNTDPKNPPPMEKGALGCASRAMNYCRRLATNSLVPLPLVYDSCLTVLNLYTGKARSENYDSLKNKLDRTFGETAQLLHLRAHHYRSWAWEARGSGYANTVSETNALLFHERLLVAEASLQKAWQLDPTLPAVPEEMVDIAMGLGRSRQQMELWFSRAMTLNSNSYFACNSKLRFVSPFWFGSSPQMFGFAHECATNVNWGGNVCLNLIEAHTFASMLLESPAKQFAYWQQPAVWADLKLAYERYLQTSPRLANDIRHKYAEAAYQCGQISEMEKQLGLLTHTNVAKFRAGTIGLARMTAAASALKEKP